MKDLIWIREGVKNLREKAFKEKLKNAIGIRGTEWGNSIPG